MPDAIHDDAVGYGRPPKKNQFQPGQSGNRKGRPRKPKPEPRDDSLAAILDRAAKETVVINGQPMTLRELEVRSLQAKAMQGNQRAMQQLWALRQEIGHGIEAERKCGVLMVPQMASIEDWAETAYHQQAPYRDGTYRDPEFERLLGETPSR